MSLFREKKTILWGESVDFIGLEYNTILLK